MTRTLRTLAIAASLSMIGLLSAGCGGGTDVDLAPAAPVEPLPSTPVDQNPSVAPGEASSSSGNMNYNPGADS